MADEFAPGIAYVESVGWEEDEEHGRRFVARLVFPTGAPDLTAGVVWKRRPVRIEVVKQTSDDKELIEAVQALLRWFNDQPANRQFDLWRSRTMSDLLARIRNFASSEDSAEVNAPWALVIAAVALVIGLWQFVPVAVVELALLPT